jgi:hypothetical protein
MPEIRTLGGLEGGEEVIPLYLFSLAPPDLKVSSIYSIAFQLAPALLRSPPTSKLLGLCPKFAPWVAKEGRNRYSTYIFFSAALADLKHLSFFSIDVQLALAPLLATFGSTPPLVIVFVLNRLNYCNRAAQSSLHPTFSTYHQHVHIQT